MAMDNAGAFIDRFTGSGMLTALESVEIPTRAITESCPPEQIADTYQKLRRQRFHKRSQAC